MTTSTAESTQTRTIGVPGAYFRKMATMDYSDWRRALAREFLQNSADAGATQAEFTLDKTNRTLTVTDDGCGMTQEVILDKLLVLGGTHKPEISGQPVGGFGKAKELLFFSWDRYEIRTNDILVRGQGAHFELLDVQPPVKGTTAQVWFASDEDLVWLEYQMKDQLKTNQPESCKVVFNGEVLDPLRRGRLVREIDYETGDETRPFAKIHLNKSKQDSVVHIRLRGITMFQKQLWTTRQGQIIIELQGESVDLLTSNRDGMQSDAQRKLDSIIHELLVDCNSSLREKPLKVERYKGEGLVAVHSAVRVQVEQLRKATEQTERYVTQATDAKELTDIIQGNNRLKHYLQGQEERITTIAAQEGLLKAKEEVQTILRALNYKPDFIVKRRDKLPKALDPQSWAPVNLKLATMWENTVKQVLINAGKDLKFAVGWTTDDDTTPAELYTMTDGNKAFLLNPYSPHLKTRNFQFLTGELVDLAIHEVTHLEHPNHNEAFVAACQNLHRRCRLTDFGGIIREAIRSL